MDRRLIDSKPAGTAILTPSSLLATYHAITQKLTGDLRHKQNAQIIGFSNL